MREFERMRESEGVRKKKEGRKVFVERKERGVVKNVKK